VIAGNNAVVGGRIGAAIKKTPAGAVVQEEWGGSDGRR